MCFALFTAFFFLSFFVEAQTDNTSSVKIDNNPFTNPGESTTRIEQPKDNTRGIKDTPAKEPRPDYVIPAGRVNKDPDNFTYTLLQPLPTEGETLNENVTLTEYLTWVYRFALAMAGFLAVLMIVIGGVEYIASGANEKLRSDAHSRIESALWGLALALAAYLILYTINPKLVNFESNQFFKTKTTTTTK